jgi:SAM-dependent methyltransferase
MKFYDELAAWWPLISDPADYAEEVAFFLPLLAEATARPTPTLLELGSGGGNNALHMKTAFAHTCLVDLSPTMLAVSQQLNPECEHHQGDMRHLRLGRAFDVVFIHDAIDYMLTLDDLRAALTTAYLHCKAGGLLLLVPDYMRETFEPETDHGGQDGAGRAVRYLEWAYDPDPTDTTYTCDYVFVLREGDQPPVVEHDRHICGLFHQQAWLDTLASVGFEATPIQDPFERVLFIARKS